VGGTVLYTTGSGASLSNVVNSITGTSNQVVASASTGAVTLSLPQSIATASTPQFTGLGIGVAATSGLITVERDALGGNPAGGTVPTNGLLLQNTTAAASNAQQVSPAITLLGTQWLTGSGGSSQTAGWTIVAQPKQGATGGRVNLGFYPQWAGANRGNGNGEANAVGFCSTVNSGSAVITISAGAQDACSTVGIGTASNGLQFLDGNGNDALTYNTTSVAIRNDHVVGFCSSSGCGASATLDTAIGRDAAGIIGVTQGTQGTTAANYRALKASAYYSAGTTFTTNTGCGTNTSLTGGATAGTFALGSDGPCTVVITMGNSATAPNGWACLASDRTTLSALVDQSASSTTTASLNVPVASLSGDVISFACIGY
jgi:hypothetical protein